MAKKKAKTPRQRDSGEQAGVNCKRCYTAVGVGRPLYWRNATESIATCRVCGAVEMLFRPTGQTSNRAPVADKPAPEPDPVAEIKKLKSEMSTRCYDRDIDAILDELAGPAALGKVASEVEIMSDVIVRHECVDCSSAADDFAKRESLRRHVNRLPRLTDGDKATVVQIFRRHCPLAIDDPASRDMLGGHEKTTDES